MISPERLREQAIEGFWETVPSLWGTIRFRIRATATARFDITVEQFHVLRLMRCGKTSVSDLVTAKNISRPAISQVVDVLVRKGLVMRIQSTQDRRYVELTLTDSGNALLDTFFKETRGWMNERMQTLNVNELVAVVEAMEALKIMME